MSSEDIKALIERMDKLTRVIAINAVKDRPPQDQVSILDGLDFTQVEIAAATGMTQGNVSKILKKLHGASRARQPKSKKGETVEGEKS